MHRKTEGILSIIMGGLGLLLWLVPIVGLCISFLGIYLGRKAKEFDESSAHLGMAGVVMNVVVLFFVVIRSGMVALLT